MLRPRQRHVVRDARAAREWSSSSRLNPDLPPRRPHSRYAGATPIFAAAQAGRSDVAQMLCERGADVNITTTDTGWTPLFAACEGPSLRANVPALIETLLKFGADVNRPTAYEGRTPLYELCQKQTLNETGLAAAKRLIQLGADVNKATVGWGRTPLIIAVHRGHLQLTKVLLAVGACVNHARTDTGVTPLISALTAGERPGKSPALTTDIVTALLAAKADVHAAAFDGTTALTVACRNGNAEVVKLLLEAGADAMGRGCAPRAKLPGLAPPLPKRNSFVTSPMYVACFFGQSEAVSILVKAGAWLDVRGTDPRGDTLLHHACGHGMLAAAELLLAAKANVNVQDSRGVAPLHAVCYNVSQSQGDGIKLARTLIAADADITLRTWSGATPLHVACARLDERAESIAGT